jgi:hypothetical protein
VAVLISPGYGSGWSTWHPDLGVDDRLLFDPQVADILLAGEPRDTRIQKIRALVAIKYPDVAQGGIPDLEVVMMAPGTRFVVREYDGNEWIETEREIAWKTA